MTPAPASLTFTIGNWETAQMVTVTAGNDVGHGERHGLADPQRGEHATPTMTASPVAGVTVTVNDNDTAQVLGLMIEPGNAQLVVDVDGGGQRHGLPAAVEVGAARVFSTSDRQATVTSDSTTSHTIGSLTNDTEYTVQDDCDPDGRLRRPVRRRR